jgi:predicted small metal-binding protein
MTVTNTNPFPHRFDTTKVHDTINVQDAFDAMADRAQGVLMLLFTHLEREGRVSDEIMQNSIDSVLNEINDMKAVINAHFATIKG